MLVGLWQGVGSYANRLNAEKPVPLTLAQSVHFSIPLGRGTKVGGSPCVLCDGGRIATRSVPTSWVARRNEMKIREAFIGYKDTGKSVLTQVMSNAKAVANYMGDAFEERPDQEQFWVILTDVKLRAMARQCVFIGTLDSIAVHPRELFRLALLASAHSIIAVHNHPSGDPSPSREDVLMTQKLREAGELLGIPLTDHVIVGREADDPNGLGHYSFEAGK